MKIGEALEAAEKALLDAGVETARHDAEWMLVSLLGGRRSALAQLAEHPFPDGAEERFEQMVVRRARREPLGYVLGTVVFRGLELEVGPGCLVPRSETEVTAGRAIERAREVSHRPTIVDVGTGCGCIALACAAEVPNARIFATEASGAARGWALRNLARTGLRVTLLPGDLMSPLHPALGGGVDVVVSNPPYVCTAEWQTLEPEVRSFEPRAAIIGGDSGLEVIEELIAQGRIWLATGGWLVLEIAESQAADVTAMMRAEGFEEPIVTKDLPGRDRVIEARWMG